MEASLHLGEKLRAIGQRDEAIAHFARAVSAALPGGRPSAGASAAPACCRGSASWTRRRATSQRARAPLPRGARRSGSDTDSSLLLGMLTQAAFNLGLLRHRARRRGRGVRRAGSARIELGQRAGHPSGWDPAAVAAFNLGHLCARRGELARARELLGSRRPHRASPSGTPLGLHGGGQGGAGAGRHGGAGGARRRARGRAPLRARGASWVARARLPEGAFAALQARARPWASCAVAAGRYLDASGHYCEALALVGALRAARPRASRVLAELRVGQTLAEVGEREEAVIRLALGVRDAGATRRRSGCASSRRRPRAPGTACSCALERWDEAQRARRRRGDASRARSSSGHGPRARGGGALRAGVPARCTTATPRARGRCCARSPTRASRAAARWASASALDALLLERPPRAPGGAARRGARARSGAWRRGCAGRVRPRPTAWRRWPR